MDHYLSDLYDQADTLEELLSESARTWQPEWTPEEQERLLKLPKLLPKVPGHNRKSVHFGLVDVLAASAFDLRVNQNERTSESGWAVAKLAATLSCSAKFDSLEECIQCFARRTLCYPLYRSYALALASLRDVVAWLRSGRVALVKNLLELIQIFNQSERYIFSQLYIEPYALWVQTVECEHFESLANTLGESVETLTKEDLQLEINEIELAAKLAFEEENEVERLAEKLNEAKIAKEGDSDDDDSDSDEDDSETSGSDDDDTSSEEEE